LLYVYNKYTTCDLIHDITLSITGGEELQ